MSTKTSTHHEQRIRALCDRFGLTMFQRGHVWVIAGPGTDIRTVDLSTVRNEDLDRTTMRRTPRLARD